MSRPPSPKRYQPSGRTQGSVPLSTQVLTLGNDHTVSFPGTSQFTAQGVSACGLAAFNFARIGFRIEQSKKSLANVLNELGTKEIIEEIVAICAGWSSNLHLEVDDIHDLPLFGRSLQLMSVEYGRPHPKHFQILLATMIKIESSAVIIITRPPEIIACFKFINTTSNTIAGAREDPVFVVFDSHPRPSHPHGAGLSFSTSIENTARMLSDILPTLDESIFDTSDMQWQAQLLSNCSAHVYVAGQQRKDHEEAVIQSSLEVLTLRARISEMRRTNRVLGDENRKLGSDVDRLRASVRLEQTKPRQGPSASWTALANLGIQRSYGLISHAVAGSSRSGGSSSSLQRPGYNLVADTPSTAHAVAGSSQYGRSSSSLQKPGYNRVADTSPTVPIRRPSPARPLQPVAAAGAKSIFANNPPPVPSKTPPVYDGLYADADSDDLWQTVCIAYKLQNEFDSEDRRLRKEHAELAQYVQVTFQCSICLDELPEDYVAKVNGCMHTMCRTCLREYVFSKIQEHRYPIFCPVCTISTERKAQPGEISRPLIEQLGVSEEQSQILMEMELAEFTIQIHCRKCRRAESVDRQDYLDAFNIVCPQRDCQHVWCKKCEQTIIIDGPKHSCDGSNELAHLMSEKGWKRCPNCTTAILKEMGCNHMSCISPGCNTHFCYVCGGMIVRSALNQEINQAVSAHFRKCQLFEIPD